MNDSNLKEDEGRADGIRRSSFLSRALVAVFIFTLGYGASLFLHDRPAEDSAGGIVRDAKTALRATIADVFSLPKREKILEIDLGAPIASSGSIFPEVFPDSPPFFGGVRTDDASAPSGFSGTASVTAPKNDGRPSGTAAVLRAPLANQKKEKELSPCAFDGGGIPDHSVIISEIAWMGSPLREGRTASQASANEWIELQNVSHRAVQLRGWQLRDAEEKIFAALGDYLLDARAFYFLERTGDDAVPDIRADQVYVGALANSGAWLRLFDGECRLVDEVNAEDGWPAGDRHSKRTMERDADSAGWHSSAAPGGTPRRENSIPPAPTSSSPLAEVPSGTSSAFSGERYSVTVTLAGSGGTVVSEPEGIFCGSDCRETYARGTHVRLTATTTSGIVLQSWSSPCFGSGTCGFLIERETFVTAQFGPPRTQENQGSSGGSGASGGVPNTGGIVLISEIMAGSSASADDEFIELYNSGSAPADLTGWTIKKRSSTGNESALVAASRLEGKMIAAGAYLLLAHEGGYAGSVAADIFWPPSYSLAYTNNAIVLYDAQGTKVEEVSWVEIPAGQSYVRTAWSGNEFQTSPSPSPQNSGR